VTERSLAVVVVAHESAGALGPTLAAVRAQLREGDELVVVDNGSGDGSAGVARAAGATVIAQPNLGFAAGCHAGARATAAPLLFFLNPDARVAPGCLDALRDADPGWGAWQALVLLPGGERVNTAGGVTHWLGFGWAGGCDGPAARVDGAPHEVSWASGAALVVRRAAWEAVGGLDPAYFLYGEDLDLGLRLRLAGWGVGIVPAARVEHDYAFEKGEYKWYFLERNRWWTVLGAYPAPLLLAVLPALLAFEVALLAVAARAGWLPAKLRAQRDVVRSLRRTLRRRRRIQAGGTLGARGFATALTASLDSPYLGAAAEVGVLRRAQAGYWRAARALLP
jgi:N-acetylglucosaminyl-diphospho-decaprenol L-rhamnosyltransferase